MMYKIISRTLILITSLFLVTSIEVSAQVSITDPGNIAEAVELPDNTIENVIIVGDLTFFDNEDEALFNNTCPVLSVENFEDTNVGPNSAISCGSTINNLTNNTCYSPGALIPGFSLSAVLVDVITPNAFGLTNVAVGADSPLDDSVITFTESVNAVGMELTNIVVPSTTVDVQVFGVGNVFLGTATVNVTPINSTFLGVIAGGGELITRIELVGGTFELLYELSFGECQCQATIVKSATPANDTVFEFLVDDAPDFSLSDPSDTTEEILIDEGDTLTVTEQLPVGWQLDDVVCDVTGGIDPTLIDGGVSLECSAGNGVAACTFFNSLAPRPIPTLSEWGLIAMAGILGIVGFMVMRRRKATA